MNANNGAQDQRQVSHARINGLTFGMFSADEIRNISVLHVQSPLNYDNLGQPITGGTYDLRMGPTDMRDDSCKTCQLSVLYCPGHLGHIDLILPVVNPMFLVHLMKLLSVTCFRCHSLRHSSLLKHKFLTQLKLIDGGLFNFVDMVEEIFVEVAELKKAGENTAAFLEQSAMREMDKLYNEVISGDVVSSSLHLPQTRCVVAIQNKLKNLFFKLRKSICYNCQRKCGSLVYVQERFIYMKSKKIVEAAEEEENEDDVVSEEAEKEDNAAQQESVFDWDVKMTKENEINITLLMQHLRKVYKKDQALLDCVLPILVSGKFQHPTDVFFLEAVPVVPPKYRPVNVTGGGINIHHQSTAYVCDEG